MINSNNKIFNLNNIFLAVWFIYHMQSHLIPLGGFSILLFIFQVSVSIYCLLYANKYYDIPPTLRAINCLVILYFIYGTIRVMGGEQLTIRESSEAISSLEYTRHYINSLLPIYVSFVLTKSGQITISSLKFWSIAFIGFSCIEYYGVLQDLAAANAVQDEFTNNTGYHFLAIIPVILLSHKNSIIRYLLIFIVTLFIISAMKRGAILITLISLLYIIYLEIKKSSAYRRYIILLLIALVGFGIYKYTLYMLDTSDMFNMRITETLEGDSSSRNIIQRDIIQYLRYNNSIFEFFFGKGADGTLKVTVNFAHNDWLEIATNMGLLGIIFFIYFWICFIKDIVTSRNPDIKHILILLFIFCFSRTIFSMSITDMPIYTSYILGFCLAKYQSNEQN